MNFASFQDHRKSLLGNDSGLVDAAETNLYRSLKSIPSPVKQPSVVGTIHRCHLASQWVEYFGLPSETSRRALVSCGVRDGLATIFAHFASTGGSLWLPDDNYPVYHDLATEAGLVFRVFSTLPEPVWPDPAVENGNELLLVTNPLKPRGRWLNQTDLAALRLWLAASSRRRIILDVVYSLGATFHPTIIDLLNTDRVIVLHSLTKGWLHPRLFGIALVPEQDAEFWMPTFRAVVPSQENLAKARHLLTHHMDMPTRVVEQLETAKQRLVHELPDIMAKCLPVNAPGYFFPVAMPWQDLLNGGVLGLPASVFGSRREDLTILSSLTFAA